MHEDRVKLTEKGRARILGSPGKHVPHLSAGDEYVINEDGGTDWVPLPDCEAMRPYRHDWVIKLRPRPHTPVLLGMAKPLTKEEQAQRLLLLFCPWTLNDEEEESNGVMPVLPYLGALRSGSSASSWTHALRAWLWHHLPTEKTLRLVRNFAF
eukprot:379666-Amphidinium_carterae.1